MANDGTCELCGIDYEHLDRHHLVPRHKGGKRGPIALLCRACHRQIHRLFSNSELKRELSSIADLWSHPAVQKWLHWKRRREARGG